MDKAIILDLDGTLLDSKRTITGFSREVLRRCRSEGILIIIALIFGAVGCGIAMENSTRELQEVARHVTESNDNHGVAKGILRYVFGK